MKSYLWFKKPRFFNIQYLNDIPAACWMHLVLTLLNSISVGVCFFLALYFNLLSFDIVKIGLLMSSYGLGTVVGGILFGKLCDKYPAMILLKLCIFIQGLSFLSLSCVTTQNILLFVLFILGLSAYGFKTSNNVQTLSYCYSVGSRNKIMNFSYAISNFGLGISGVLVGLISSANFRIIFLLAGGLLLSILLYLQIKNIDHFALRRELQSIDKSEKIINKRSLLLALMSVFFVGLIIAQLGSTYPIYIKESFPVLGDKGISILFILDTVLIVLFQVPLSNMLSNKDPIFVMGAGAFLMGLGMLMLSFSSYFSLAVFSCCLWTTGEMLFIPSSQLIIYENSTQTKKGQSIGMFQSTYAISTVVGPLLGGYLYSSLGRNSMWYLSAIIGTLCLFFCLTSLNHKYNNLILNEDA